jgi:hypothetical protein
LHFTSAWVHNDPVKRWWQCEGDELGREVENVGMALKKDQDWRIHHARHMLDVYEGREHGLWSESQEEELNYNLSRAACDTVHAEISGRQKPVPKFQTSDADWKTKRRAKKLEKFVVGVFNQPQCQYLNIWQLMEDAWLDASILGMSPVKVFADGEKITCERHFAHEIFVDPIEAKYGSPKSLFHIYTMDKDAAIAQFADELDGEEKAAVVAAIESSSPQHDELFSEIYSRGSGELASNQIQVVEAWRLRHSKDKPGIHAFSINGTLVYSEEWDRDSFPFVFLFWERTRVGFGGIGLVEQGLPIHTEVNENAAKLQERFRLCGNKRTYYYEGSLDLEKMQTNEAENLIPVKPGHQFPQEPAPKPIADAEMIWLNDAFQKYFEITGVSQMRASARKEPGVTAGVAIRTLNDMQTARFSLKAKGYESGYIQLTNQIIICAREMNDAGIKLVAKNDNEKIDWENVSLPEDTFDITIAPTSSLPNDPAGRMQMTQELYSAGVISIETYKQLLGWPDLEKEMNSQTSQTRWIERCIDRMLDEGDYEEPSGFILDKARALLQVGQAYFEALYNDAPHENLRLLERYMVSLDRLIMATEAEIARKTVEMQQHVDPEAGAVAPPQAGPPPAGPGNRPPLEAAE